MTETESGANGDQLEAWSPAINDVRRIRPRRKHIVWSALAVVIAGLVAGLIWFIRFAPLEIGTSWGPITSSADAWRVDHSYVEASNAVIARNEHLARVDLEFTIRNGSGFAVKLLSATPAVELGREPVCGWQPIDVKYSVPSWYDDGGTELDPPFTLRSHDEVNVHVAGQIGTEEVGPCTLQEALQWSELELPLRYSLLGIARTQEVPLDLIIGISDDPEMFLEIDMNELEPLD